jgi:glycosyltransferase involved in cell wall biosynthesis
MDASIVIPTHNREAVLSRVLRYYGAQELEGERFELVVVDDGSTDVTPALFERLGPEDRSGLDPSLGAYVKKIWTIRRGTVLTDPPRELIRRANPIQVTYVQIEKSGRSVARNIGVYAACAPLILFADDDIFVEPEFVKKHLAAHLFNRLCVVMGKVIHTPSLENPLSSRWKLKDLNTAFLATGNASVPKRAIIEAGMFDEGYTVYGWEDFDLGIHLQERGFRSLKRPIFGYHYDPPQGSFAPGDVYKKEKERGFTAVYFYTNHPLRWVRRFTLMESGLLRSFIGFLGRNNWFLKKSKIARFKRLLRLIVRYKGYFDGVAEGKERYLTGKIP